MWATWPHNVIQSGLATTGVNWRQETGQDLSGLIVGSYR